MGFLCAKGLPLYYQDPGLDFFFFWTKTQYRSCDLRNSFQPCVLFLCCGRSAFQDNLFCMLLKLPTKEGRAATVERQPSLQGEFKENDWENVGVSQTY